MGVDPVDTLGINWRYLLLQLVACVVVLSLSILTATMLLLALRALRPGIFSAHLSDLVTTPEGIVVPDRYLQTSGTYELRQYGKAFLLAPKSR